VEVGPNQLFVTKSPPLWDHKKPNFFHFGQIEVEIEEVEDIVW
jgi:hypothetical protein